MGSNNFYLNIYRKKTTDELKTIVFDSNSTTDSKLTAISILRERNENIEELNLLETQLVLDLNENHKISEFAEDKYSTSLRRFLALIIDGFVLFGLNIVFWFFKGIESVFLVTLLGFISFLIPYMYNILLHGYFGQTIGKMLMRVKIYDKSETKITSLKQAFMRDCIPLILVILLNILSLLIKINEIEWLAKISLIITIIITFWSLLEIVTMFFNKKRRALHDFIAGTVVIKINN